MEHAPFILLLWQCCVRDYSLIMIQKYIIDLTEELTKENSYTSFSMKGE